MQFPFEYKIIVIFALLMLLAVLVHRPATAPEAFDADAVIDRIAHDIELSKQEGE